MPAVIGITTNQVINANAQVTVTLLQAYIEAIMQAGGVPVLLPSLITNDGWQSVYSRLDGILFSGGGDISPEHFNGEDHPRIGGVEPERDALELNLLKAAVSEGKPFLGICRGCQMVNVGLGGTLYTHIPDQLPGALDHDYPGSLRKVLVHEVKLEEGTRIAEIMGEPILKVNSHHHQGLKNIAPTLKVTGHAPDGLVEAVELPDHPFGLAVQWHPEWLTDQQPTRNLFRALVQAADPR